MYGWWVRFRYPIELAPTPLLGPQLFVSMLVTKRVRLVPLMVPVMNHAASFYSSARISCLLRFFLSSEGCCVTSVNVPTPQTMAGSVVARKRNIECRTKVKTGCATCRSVIVDISHHRSTPQDCEFRREVSAAVIVLNPQ